MMTDVNTNSKETLARLMAAENLNVVHQNVRTASFDLNTRTLTLPAWDDMSNETYDHLVGHEVGHALYTPTDTWIQTIESSGEGMKSFLNVVEDARIERMMQSRYPGLRRPFVASYRKLLADGFFGGGLEKINSMKLIDRLNVYAKCGITSGVRIERSEMKWVDAINSVVSFDDVIRVAQELYDYEKSNKDNLSQELVSNLQEEDEEFDYSDSDEEFEYSDSEEDTEEDSEEDTEEDSEEETYEYEDTKSSVAGADAGGFDEELVAETVAALEKNIKNEFSNSNTERVNVTVNWDYDVTRCVRSYKTVLFDIAIMNAYSKEFLAVNHKKFLMNNKKSIDYLVKEFEMKKAAETYARATTASAGTIDTLKMNSYKYNDDIFRKISIVPDGKSHGLLMFVDWSGSMQNCMGNTVSQLLNLVLFCRQVNIPFQVFTFTQKNNLQLAINTEADEFAMLSDAVLCEIFNSKMNSTEFKSMVEYFSVIANTVNFLVCYSNLPGCLKMGGTPLNQTIIMSKRLYEQFKSSNNLDIANIVFLTDGDSNSACMSKIHDSKVIFDPIADYDYNKTVKFLDKETKKQYRVQRSLSRNRYERMSVEYTRELLNMLRDNTGANVIGFRIFESKNSEYQRLLKNFDITDLDKVSALRSAFNKNKFAEIPNSGYSAFFGLHSKDMAINNGGFNVKSNASANDIRRAFIKSNKTKLLSRVLLNKFVDMIV